MDREDVAKVSFEERISGVERLMRVWFGEDRAQSRLERVLASADLAGPIRPHRWGRVEAEIETAPLYVIGRAELLANKRASGRDKDLRDVAVLEAHEPPRTKRRRTKSTSKSKSKPKPSRQ